ncbi:hypothetical protein [Liquorilactobacillus mali]|uniref:Prophage Lp2 protein 58 n=1 Tax=Liquorilactobacillus mali KCTC 3596 = DSM 20444 TaxID=1046596 RepID=J0KWT9_9LACO|nr:hypothetical protein [Liquorilactobacillus mali]EJE97744.1 prophage Lp2 protein 58 [Liquorilactobacillus mali KCTC 3596 = DSM 20444]KRN10847.1 prophage Lp2 protein 58 [Liquorilactobacillus mali KCTC 3596 = DSM 20444]
MLKNIKKKFVGDDGTLNGKMVAASISLLIVIVQQLLASFGIKFTGDIGAIVACINTVLAFLGLIGVFSEPATVSVDTASLEQQIVSSNAEISAAKAAANTAKAVANTAQASVDLAHTKISNLSGQVDAINSTVAAQ